MVFLSTRVCRSRGASTARLPCMVCPRDRSVIFIEYLGPPLHMAFREMVTDQSLVQPCVDAYRARYREMAASETSVVPGIREILDSLSVQLPLVVATSKPWALAEPLLEALELRRFFTAVVGPGLECENERKAVTVERAMREFSPDADLVMVGDREHDITAAREHGIRAVGVLWGIGTEEELLAAGADALAHAPAELTVLLATALTPDRDSVSQ